MAVLAYYSGDPVQHNLDNYDIEKVTHLIFCFAHLNGNRFEIANARDSAAIQKMVGLKKLNPDLKVILSLGGWGGCETCSPVFGSAEARKEFARSFKEVNDYFGTDGIDLDWEYPVVYGYPGHAHSTKDKVAFTKLVKTLRKELGKNEEVSFAAGGFTAYIDSAIQWKKVMRVVDRVNLMSYDLVGGYTTRSGHHTPLYSTPEQKESTDNAVRMMLAEGVPANKIVIGAAFYARGYQVNDTLNNGLYRPGKFVTAYSFKDQKDTLTTTNGFVQLWDSVAGAPYSFNAERKLMVSYDDPRSIQLKTEYVIEHGLNGIMFWQLADDPFKNGLLDVIDRVIGETE